MAELKLRGVRKSYGGAEVIKGFDLDVDDREFVVGRKRHASGRYPS
ncbi:hypothetical protein [Mesorhizobium sp.]|nr:hypothetical protein [Mesorhizobium sp.]